MKANSLLEETTKHASFCFGRMNPPTLGHKKLLDTVAKAAGDGDYYIFASKTHKLPDNPLDYATKFKFLQAMFPEYAEHMVEDPNLRTVMQVASWLYDLGYNQVSYVAGSDRLPEFKKLLDAYNGKGQPGDKGYYKFDKINYVSAGARDADAEGLAGISASKARAAAAEGDFEDFKAKTGAGKLAKPLYNAVRAAMNVSEDIALDSQFTTSPIHGAFKETRKPAKKEVKPGSIQKSLRPLRISEDIYHFDKEDPYNSEFSPVEGIGRMTLRGWKRTLFRRLSELNKQLASATNEENIDNHYIWDNVYQQLRSMNVSIIAREIEQAQIQLDHMRKKGKIRPKLIKDSLNSIHECIDLGKRLDLINLKVKVIKEGRGDRKKYDVKKTLKDDLRNPKDNPCWKGYYPVGTKKKNGKTVPNCVPKPKKKKSK